MSIMAFLFSSIFFFNVSFTGSFAESKKRLTPFQKNIQSCLKTQVAAAKLQTLAELYLALDVAFPLRTTEVVFREVTYRKEKQLQRLKFDNGKIQLFRVLEDQTVQLINNDARQKGLTEESSVNQLLSGADVQSDWLSIKETRLSQTQLTFSRQQGRITALNFQKTADKMRLECVAKDLSDICLCRP